MARKIRVVSLWSRIGDAETQRLLAKDPVSRRAGICLVSYSNKLFCDDTVCASFHEHFGAGMKEHRAVELSEGW